MTSVGSWMPRPWARFVKNWTSDVRKSKNDESRRRRRTFTYRSMLLIRMSISSLDHMPCFHLWPKMGNKQGLWTNLFPLKKKQEETNIFMVFFLLHKTWITVISKLVTTFHTASLLFSNFSYAYLSPKTKPSLKIIQNQFTTKSKSGFKLFKTYSTLIPKHV